MTDIRELSLWEDCPFREMVPEVYQIRHGVLHDKECLAIVFDGGGVVKHVVVQFKEQEDLPNIKGFVVPMVGSLGGAIFEERHPETYMALVKRDAQRAAGIKPNPVIRSRRKQEKRDAELWKEYHDLTKLREVSCQV